MNLPGTSLKGSTLLEQVQEVKRLCYPMKESMNGHELRDTSEMNRPSVNNVIRNLFSLMAFKYQNHEEIRAAGDQPGTEHGTMIVMCGDAKCESIPGYQIISEDLKGSAL